MSNPAKDYLIFSAPDVDSGLSPEDAALFHSLAKQIEEYRVRSGQPPLTVAVVEADCPEYAKMRSALDTRAFVEEQLWPAVPSDVMATLAAITQAAMRIGEGPRMERVAVPNPNGGYYMAVRPVAGQIEG